MSLFDISVRILECRTLFDISLAMEPNQPLPAGPVAKEPKEPAKEPKEPPEALFPGFVKPAPKKAPKKLQPQQPVVPPPQKVLNAYAAASEQEQQEKKKVPAILPPTIRVPRLQMTAKKAVPKPPAGPKPSDTRPPPAPQVPKVVPADPAAPAAATRAVITIDAPNAEAAPEPAATTSQSSSSDAMAPWTYERSVEVFTGVHTTLGRLDRMGAPMEPFKGPLKSLQRPLEKPFEPLQAP